VILLFSSGKVWFQNSRFPSIIPSANLPANWRSTLNPDPDPDSYRVDIGNFAF
jgi:hypothetical protein